MAKKTKSSVPVVQNPILAQFQNIESILTSRRNDHHARYVALDVVRQSIAMLRPPKTGVSALAQGNSSLAMFLSSRSAKNRETREKIISLLRDRGDKIQAIRELRAATGLGLKDAKDIVEQYRPFADAIAIGPSRARPII